MMSSFVKEWGRGAALAWFTLTYGTLIMGAVLVMFGQSLLPVAQFNELLGSYFLMLTVVGGASQAPNVVERFPGVRTFNSPPGSVTNPPPPSTGGAP